MDKKPGVKRLHSRRQFLKGLPLGVAGALAIGVISDRLASLALGRRPPVFPEDSIFTPAKDRRRQV